MTAAQSESVSPRRPGEQVCAMLGIDIVGYTAPARNEEARLRLRESLYAILKVASDLSGIPWDECRREDQGDGILMILPAGMSPSRLIGPLPLLLCALVREHNHKSVEAVSMQLRLAVHMGLIFQDPHGVAGDDINYLFRMLDARPLRQALTDSGAEAVLAVSRYVYESVVQRYPTRTDPAQFRHVKSRVKGTPVDAWLHIPGVYQ